MIVYVESNFVLEAALGQEEAAAVEQILASTDRGELTLVIPGFSLAEPYATLTHRERTRERLRTSLTDQLRQLRRSSPHQDAATALEPLLRFLDGLDREELRRLQAVVERVLATAQVVPFDAATFAGAADCQGRFGLSPQDAIVCASILADLRARPATEPKVFVSRNWKDFNHPLLIEELHGHSCRYEESYQVALDRARDETGTR